MADDVGVLGPVGYLVVEFPGNKMTGEGFPILVDLVDRGLVRIIDLDIKRWTFKYERVDCTAGVERGRHQDPPAAARSGLLEVTQDIHCPCGSLLAPGKGCVVQRRARSYERLDEVVRGPVAPRAEHVSRRNARSRQVGLP